MKTRIKICGITQKDQALEIGSLEIDAMGFILYPPSPRYISPEKLKPILSVLPPFLKTIGVFVNEPIDALVSIVHQTGLDMVQLSGDETVDYCTTLSEIGVSWIKGIRIKNEDDYQLLNTFNTNYFLLDAWSDKEYGGTGKTLDWDKIKETKNSKQIILAGGIKPDNVKNAIQKVNPYAIDVSSGVEIEPGVKSMEKVRKLIREIG